MTLFTPPQPEGAGTESATWTPRVRGYGRLEGLLVSGLPDPSLPSGSGEGEGALVESTLKTELGDSSPRRLRAYTKLSMFVFHET